MRYWLYGACVVMCSVVVASCENGVSPVGEPPLTGVWTPGPVPGDFVKVCGIDTPCRLHLRLFGADVTGAFEEHVFFQTQWSGVPLHGTYNPPSVHVQWNEPYTVSFDGEVRGDTLMVGILTPYLGHPDSLHWARTGAR